MSRTASQTSFLRVVEFADRVGSSPAKIRLLIKSGKVAAERDSDRGMFLIAEDECERYLTDRRTRSATSASSPGFAISARAGA